MPSMCAACARMNRTAPTWPLQHMGTPEDGPITLRATVYSGDAEISEGSSSWRTECWFRAASISTTAFWTRPVLTNGYVRVERVEGRAPFYAYGVINDQGNSDGSFVFPVTASSLGGTHKAFPQAANPAGDRRDPRSFSSELMVANFSEEAKRISFRFVADGIRTDESDGPLQYDDRSR